MRRDGSPMLSLWHLAAMVITYRLPLKVTEVRVFRSPVCGTTGYYVCPRCKTTMEREYMAYCSRCGQRLDWSDCENAQEIYPESRDPMAPSA